MKKLILITILLITLLGCEEVIEVDINSTDPQIIIEAQITDSIEKNGVHITKSTDFYEPNKYDKISSAEIIVEDEMGTSYILSEVEPGFYQHNSLITQPSTEYSISVKLGNDIYKAESFAPPVLNIDSLSYKFEPRPFNDKQFLELHVHFQDPVDESNYARIVVYKNDKKIDKIFLYNDRLTNGNEIDFFFFNFDEDEEFKSGDIIKVELWSIDQTSHTYFRTLRRALAASTGGPFGPASPANPTTNWSNNAFGYFSASGIRTMSMRIE